MRVLRRLLPLGCALAVVTAAPARADTGTPSPGVSDSPGSTDTSSPTESPSPTDTPSSTDTPSPTASPTPLIVVPTPTNAAVSYPVEDLNGPVQDLIFGAATEDGAVTNLGGTEFRLSSDVLFAFNKADLNARARKEIAAIVGTLTAESPGALSVTGFTDTKGSAAYNLALSQRRAAAVRRVLAAALGAAVPITAAGRGEEQPIASNATASGQALNRRVEIRVR